MIDFSYDSIEECLKHLKLDISIPELAALAADRSMSEESLTHIHYLLSYLSDKKTRATMVAALVDRLTFRSYILDMNGDSYRLDYSKNGA